MCGIISIIDQEDRPVPESELQQALALVQHRGPDGQGQYFGPNLALGHQRLAIIDLSEQGRQPMSYKGLVVTYNGELYNYIELREELRQKGYTFHTESDTEVLLAAYHHWGPECVQHFNGMWAFVLYDPHNNRIFCSRDRYGIKPLYYARIGQRFCIASEIKQLRAITGWTAQLNPIRAYEFLIKGYHDHTDQTLFKGVKQLRGGQNILYDLDCHCHSIQTYYQPNSTAPLLSTSFAEQCEQFRSLLLDAVRLRLRADVKVGTALSGGLDSSSIAALMNQLLQAKNAQEQQEAVSSCFDDPRFDEQEYIDALAQQKDIRSHRVFPDFDQLREELDQLQWHQDEPVASASVYAQYCVFRMAKEKGITVMLDGQGADEILGGYEKFYAPYFKTMLRQAPWQLPMAFFRLATIHTPTKLLKLGREKYSAATANTDWLHPEFVPPQERLFTRSPEKTLRSSTINLLREVGLPILLHYEDRNAMAFGVESRLPFLDYRLVDFLLQVPDTSKINQARRKYMLRQALRKELPTKIRRRYDKMAFATPQSVWIQQHKAWFDRELAEASELLAPIIRPAVKWEQQDSALRWRVMAFARWYKQFEVKA